MKRKSKKHNTKQSIPHKLASAVLVSLIFLGIIVIPFASVYGETKNISIGSTPNNKDLSIAFVGDSITNGGDATSWSKVYTNVFTTKLLSLGFNVTKEQVGISGIATGGMIDYLYVNPDKIPKNQNLVIIELGTNDYFQHTTKDKFISNYRYLAQELKASSPNATIVCLNTWQPSSDNPYNLLIEENCPGIYMNINPLYSDSTNHGPIGARMLFGERGWFHPNNKGHAMIANTLFETLTLSDPEFAPYFEQ